MTVAHTVADGDTKNKPITLLLDILSRYIPNTDIINLLKEIISSFRSKGSPCSNTSPKGLPLGNLTSQLLVILSASRSNLGEMLAQIEQFLALRLNLRTHPDKVSITTLASGVDFLGWVHFPDHRVLRSATKRRMMRRLQECESDAARESYRGMLGWGNGTKLQRKIDCDIPQ